MATSQEDIKGWLDEAKEKGAHHMIVVCDTFSYDDYPVYVLPGQATRIIMANYDGLNMQKIMEVYSLKMDIQAQLKQHRAFNCDD